MLKKRKGLLFFLILLIFLITVSFPPNSSHFKYTEDEDTQNPNFSGSMGGIDNIIITDIIRSGYISGFGVVRFEDIITFKNLNENPINSIFITIRLNESENLIYFDAKGVDDNTLLTERSHMIMGEYEMITVYFDSPLLPQQTKTIKFSHHYNNLLWYHIQYSPENELQQYINFRGTVFPTLPYKAERKMVAVFHVDERAGAIEGDWGFPQGELYFVKYEFTYIKDSVSGPYITPFLENLNDLKTVTISYFQNEYVRMEFEEIKREIYISPWGIIRVTEKLNIRNTGIIGATDLYLDLPQFAKEIYISDDIGEILGVSSHDEEGTKKIRINLLTNRVRLIPNSSFQFNLRYYLPFENYFSINWMQESINIDLFSTSYDYLGKQLSIAVIIDGCYSLDYISEPPEAIKKAQGSITLFYTSDYVSPLQSRIIQFTFTIDLFDLLLRPILIILVISLVASIYVLLIKIRKKDDSTPLLAREFIPVNEIREFCSLYEERNALLLEIRQAEEDAKRKKIAKKNYKNILTKNTSKVDEIQQEITPFKKLLNESGETFENTVKKLDVLEAERISIKDSLNLLESRYKRGRLPSRAAYMKLSDDFKKRRKKIDRTIDKFLQQLRSYLL
ncbi:MAG: hypothetical protein ACW98D_18755 [Promethearchaeota archaeon]|jgi:hypothetical protein